MPTALGLRVLLRLKIEFVTHHGIGENETGSGNAIVEQLHDQALQLFNRADHHFHHERIAAGYVVALAHGFKRAKALGKDKVIIINLSGRGDKDVQEVARLLGKAK